MRYRRPSKLRRIAKWAGLGLCVFLFCVWIVNYWWHFGYKVLEVSAGRIVFCDDLYWIGRDDGWFGRFMPQRYRKLEWMPHSDRRKGSVFLYIPLWMPLTAIGIPTAILWHRDRRPRKGHCPHCGYNLTGNESGVCPECSTPVPNREATA